MMLRKWIVFLFVWSSITFLSNPVSAYVGAEPFPGLAGSEIKLSLFVASSEIDYDLDEDDEKCEVERTILGVNLSKGISEKLNIYGTLGYLFDGNLKSGIDIELDEGYYLSAGLKYKAFQSGKLSGHLYGQFDYVIEETYADTYNGVSLNLEIDGFEITLGGVKKYQMDSNLSLYGGIAFVPLTDQSIDLEASRNGARTTLDYDLERDDKLGLKIGGEYIFDKKWAISGEADFGSEQTYVVSVGAKF